MFDRLNHARPMKIGNKFNIYIMHPNKICQIDALFRVWSEFVNKKKWFNKYAFVYARIQLCYGFNKRYGNWYVSDFNTTCTNLFCNYLKPGSLQNCFHHCSQYKSIIRVLTSLGLAIEIELYT